jgi:flap endonuclease GEN
MLEMMGILCVTSDGEAEALCARLDADGVVDGCFTQDSDAFLYGARRVFRNFRVTKTRGGGGATFDVYDMDRIEALKELDRECLIALALLLGCDYDAAGVANVGKQKALDLLRDWRVRRQKPLERLGPFFHRL